MRQLRKEILKSKKTLLGSISVHDRSDYLLVEQIFYGKKYFIYNKVKNNFNEIYEDIVKLSDKYDYIIFDKEVFLIPVKRDDIGFSKQISNFSRKIKTLNCNFLFMHDTYNSMSTFPQVRGGKSHSYSSEIIIYYDGHNIKIVKNRYSNANREVNGILNKFILNKKLRKIKDIAI